MNEWMIHWKLNIEIYFLESKIDFWVFKFKLFFIDFEFLIQINLII